MDRPKSRAAAGDGRDGVAPRYQQVAAALKQAISTGRYPVGAQLPTELELCAHYGVSRFTARAAVETLASAGLVTRRQRTGTTVIATPEQARFGLDLTTIDDLLQYVRETTLRFAFVGRIALDRARAKAFGAAPGEEWIYAVGIRRAGDARGRPLGVTRLFLNPALAGIEAKLRTRRSAVYALIEKDFGRVIERVEQELTGTILDADDAANLGLPTGAPALKIERRYFDADGQLLEFAETLHPSDRFAYRMVLRR